MASTLKDVAKLSGVSVATISNVITRKKYVSPEVTLKVKQAMYRLNYRPNMIARSLKIKKTNNIGVIVPDIGNPFFADIVKGVERVAKREGCQLFLANTDGDAKSEEAAFNAFVSQNVDGIVNIAPRMPDAELLCRPDMPQVVLDRHIDPPVRMGCVYADCGPGCRELARHFLALGHRRFACFTGPVENVPNARDRLETFRAEVLRAGVAARDFVAYSGEFSYENGYAFMKKLLSRRSLATAVFVSSDIMAWGALESARERGLRIPEDMAIAGYDNVYFAALIAPALTTVKAPQSEAGRLGFRLLLDLIAGNQHAERLLALETELVVRASTDFDRKMVKQLND
ncbi:MAG: LacI family transcriptional regulator [Planctomycetota bacterium]|jgi:DNA-binding LacI/PurR family transcriptional regulator|nr:LacI family transcriptional regulator [Planctomycetota bacterium]